MTTAHWASQYGSGSQSVGAQLPSCAVTIPARATINRVVMHAAVAGIVTSSANNYLEVNGCYFDNLLTVKDGVHPDHVLHKAYEIVPGSFATLFDSGAIPGVQPNRIFYALYQAGDRELGCNLRVSWGGPAYTSPMTVSTACGLFKLGALAGAQFSYGYTMGIRVLYYN